MHMRQRVSAAMLLRSRKSFHQRLSPALSTCGKRLPQVRQLGLDKGRAIHGQIRRGAAVNDPPARYQQSGHSNQPNSRTSAKRTPKPTH